MKTLFRFAAFAGLILTTGCAYTIGDGSGVKVISNIPYHSLTVKVVNGTNLAVTLVDDSGKNSRTIQPGGVAVHNFVNFSGASATASLVAMATDGGKIVGSATRSFYVSGYSRQSETWLLKKWNFSQ